MPSYTEHKFTSESLSNHIKEIAGQQKKERAMLHMAIYHCCVKIIGRGCGRSSVGAAAYRAGEKLTNGYDGITHDYNNRNAVSSAAYRSGGKLTADHDGTTHDFTNKNGVVYSEIMLPKNAPIEYLDRSTLWNAVEEVEKQKNSQLAREVEIALPNELNREQQIKLVQDYVRKFCR